MAPGCVLASSCVTSKCVRGATSAAGTEAVRPATKHAEPHSPVGPDGRDRSHRVGVHEHLTEHRTPFQNDDPHRLGSSAERHVGSARGLNARSSWSRTWFPTKWWSNTVSDSHAYGLYVFSVARTCDGTSMGSQAMFVHPSGVSKWPIADQITMIGHATDWLAAAASCDKYV